MHSKILIINRHLMKRDPLFIHFVSKHWLRYSMMSEVYEVGRKSPLRLTSAILKEHRCHFIPKRCDDVSIYDVMPDIVAIIWYHAIISYVISCHDNILCVSCHDNGISLGNKILMSYSWWHILIWGAQQRISNRYNSTINRV